MATHDDRRRLGRAVRPLSELIVVSDSRLGPGDGWDSGPKLFTLPGFLFVLAFAGDTEVAYPYVLQSFAQIQAYGANARRANDVVTFAKHLASSINQMRSQMAKSDSIHDGSECQVLVAGWSWKELRYRAFTVEYDRNLGSYSHHSARAAPKLLGGRAASPLFAMVGDPQP